MSVRSKIAIPIACVALTLGAAMIPAVSQAAVDVAVTVAPPAPRFEAVPPARRGYVWIPGYWRWSGRAHVWVRGYWAPEHRGMHWYPPVWAQRPGGWYMQPGHWAR